MTITHDIDALRHVTSSAELREKLDQLVPQVRVLEAADVMREAAASPRLASAEAACASMAAELVVLRKIEAAVVKSLRAAGHLPAVGANGSAGVGPDVRADLLRLLGVDA